MNGKIIAAIVALCVTGYFVWLLTPSLFTRDSNLLVTLFLLGNAVGFLLTVRWLYRQLRK
ncbi:MAG: hypothetical protein II976_03965 [Alistipes sp.]|nr:hypothetical protein [Alistipes sp.]